MRYTAGPDRPNDPAGTVGTLGLVGGIVGLDIGGSKTQGALWLDGELAGEARAGSANVQNVTPAEAARSLRELFAGLVPEQYTGGIAHVIAGSGGVDTPDDAERLRGLIAPHAPGATIDVVHDTRLILAAGGAREGIAVIAGTGSAAWGIGRDGREARSGGWGYLLGDEGSGYWVAREAVRRALHRHDLGLPPDGLDAAVLALNNVQAPAELIGLFHSGAGRSYWAAQAQAVFDAAQSDHGDAGNIIEQVAADLTRLVLDVSSVIGVPGPVVMGGGLAMHQPELQSRLRARLGTEGITDVVFLQQAPVMGALYLADHRKGTP